MPTAPESAIYLLVYILRRAG